MMPYRRLRQIALALWKWALLERRVDCKPGLKETRETIALSPVEGRKEPSTFSPTVDDAHAPGSISSLHAKLAL